jgi:glutamine amidotransferase
VIAIVNYQAGNLASVKKALDYLDQESVITADPAMVARAERVVLPGVGHFSVTAALARSGLADAIRDSIQRGVPFLGICVGLQWLFAASEEAPGNQGLGLFAGKCERFPASVKSPHVGWNSIELCRESRLFCGVPQGAFVYYTHSYRAPLVPEAAATSEYGGTFTAAVERDNVFGVQFHPEKSGKTGLKILENVCSV